MRNHLRIKHNFCKVNKNAGHTEIITMENSDNKNQALPPAMLSATVLTDGGAILISISGSSGAKTMSTHHDL